MASWWHKFQSQLQRRHWEIPQCIHGIFSKLSHVGKYWHTFMWVGTDKLGFITRSHPNLAFKVFCPYPTWQPVKKYSPRSNALWEVHSMFFYYSKDVQEVMNQVIYDLWHKIKKCKCKYNRVCKTSLYYDLWHKMAANRDHG